MMTSKIKDQAINYQEGTLEKSCLNCVYSNIKQDNGLICDYYDLPTQYKSRCGLWLSDNLKGATK